MRVLIATPAFGNMVSTDYIGSLLNTLFFVQQTKLPVSLEVYFLKHESLVSRARNNCASYAMRGGFDKLLFIDADQAWTPKDFGRLLSSEKKLVGGTYCKKTLPWDLNFTPTDEHAKYFPDGVKSAERFAAYAEAEANEAGEVRVKHLPTGFLMIDREVLEDVRAGCPKYFAKDNQHSPAQEHWDLFPVGVIGSEYLSEDWFFCSIAREAGHDPYLNTKVIVDHLGQLNYRIPEAQRPHAALTDY